MFALSEKLFFIKLKNKALYL